MDEYKYKTMIRITHDKEILPYMNKVIDLKKINNIQNFFLQKYMIIIIKIIRIKEIFIILNEEKIMFIL